MTATYLTPGVYVEELPGGARAIEGVATSNTLFAGFTLRGPIGEPQRIASWSEYVAAFGGVNAAGASTGINDFRGGTPDVDYMGHALLSYFQNGGKIAYVARMADDTVAATGAMLQPANLKFVAANPGSWADGIRIVLQEDDVNSDAGDASVGTRYTVRIGRLNQRGGLQTFEEFDNVSLDPAMDTRYIQAVLSESEFVKVQEQEEPPVPAVLADIGPAMNVASETSGPIEAGDFPYEANTDAKRKIEINAESFTIDEGTYADASGLAAAIQSATGPAYLTTVVYRSGQQFLKVSTPPIDTANAAELDVKATAGIGNRFRFGAAATQAVGGTDGAQLFDGANGTPALPLAYQTMFEALELNTDVNVIVLPNAAWDAVGKGTVGVALAHCEKMGNRVLIIDPKEDHELKTPKTVSDEGYPTSTYSQLYYPWARVPNPIYHPDRAPTAPRQVLIPPSSFAAGMWGRIDARRGVWKAPAGVETALVGVASFEFDVGDPQQEVLNPAGVNALRRKPGYGNVIWGARTLATRANPEWRYVPVRRTAIMIEEALRRGIQWAVFEGNDHRLWSSLRVTAESYMDGLFRSGAFQGERTSDGYKVECGLGSTMTQGDIDRGYVILKVMFAPLKPAEFVVIHIQQLAGQV